MEYASTRRSETAWRRRRRRAARYTRRLLALALYTFAAVLVFQIVYPYVSERFGGDDSPAAVDEAPATPPARPASVPATIPPWAWEMHSWHSRPEADRPRRPAGAPRRLPAWYWDWRAWRLAVEARD